MTLAVQTLVRTAGLPKGLAGLSLGTPRLATPGQSASRAELLAQFAELQASVFDPVGEQAAPVYLPIVSALERRTGSVRTEALKYIQDTTEIRDDCQLSRALRAVRRLAGLYENVVPRMVETKDLVTRLQRWNAIGFQSQDSWRLDEAFEPLSANIREGVIAPLLAARPGV